MVSVAVLVDGDNFSGKHAALILKVAKDMGDPTVVRVYADAQRQSDWHKVVGFRLIHAGTGKNASDLLLVIDAMELVLARKKWRAPTEEPGGVLWETGTDRRRNFGVKRCGWH